MLNYYDSLNIIISKTHYARRDHDYWALARTEGTLRNTFNIDFYFPVSMYMLGQETEKNTFIEDWKKPLLKKFCEKSEIIEYYESVIDPDEELYMITWSPNPDRLPKTDFYLQHEVNIPVLTSFLKTCRVGLWCVESTMIGNPHYHGFYQINPETEMLRIAMVKTLFALSCPKGVKITKSVGHWRVNSYSKHANCLYYYKKEVFNTMLNIENNPVSVKTESFVDFDLLTSASFFDTTAKKIDFKVRQSDEEFYKNFFTNTTYTLRK